MPSRGIATSSTDPSRPDPDALLAQVLEQAQRAARGRLRIYFGAAAGVGKTYAMLAAAARMQDSAHDMPQVSRQALVGIVETHGRRETEALLAGLEILPRKIIDHRDRRLAEFDLDAALARRPSLILVDELAHANAQGSRHPKRWQDVEELLAAGIDVFSTLNVQHLESLNDVVGGITGIRVAETVPDKVFDAADEVLLVDLPADELLARLKAGKVYQGPQVERASKNFFRKGNLIALRELALRRTAERVESDVAAYRVEQSIGTVWKTGVALVACIGPREEDGEHAVRSAARLASQLNGAWHAIYVETPGLQRLSPARRERILETLKLAETLGATTAVLAGNDIAGVIGDYARSRNVSRILLGRGHRTWPWRSPHQRRLARLAPDVDLIELGASPSRPGRSPAAGRALRFAATGPRPEDDPPSWATTEVMHLPGTPSLESPLAGPAANAAAPSGMASPRSPNAASHPWGYFWAAAASLATAAIALLLPDFDLANIVMLFLLTVVLVAVRFGRGASVVATVVAVAACDFFFVPPRFSFSVAEYQYLVTFAVMLAVGLITGHLTSDLRYQARVASQREARSRTLYEFARELSGALQAEQIVEHTHAAIRQTFRARAVLLLPDAAGRLQLPTAAPSAGSGLPNLSVLDLGIAQWSFEQATPAGMGTDTLPSSRLFYLPLQAPMRLRGVLALEPANRRRLMIPEQRRHLETFATLAAIALERVHYIQVAQEALVHMESERLRNALLAAVSHDLRTPLTSVVGMSEALALAQPPLSPAQQGLAEGLRSEALRMHHLVTNLLDMARIESGGVRLNLAWQAVEEVVGGALRASDAALAGHEVQVRLAPGLPLVRFDAVLIERVLCNLLENAAKYTPAGARIGIAAQAGGGWLTVSVTDNGSGLPPGREEALFEKFTRGQPEWAIPGVGLGLAICRAIVNVHGGTIRAEAAPEGGAAFVFTLPLGSPPAMPDTEDSQPGFPTAAHQLP